MKIRKLAWFLIVLLLVPILSLQSDTALAGATQSVAEASEEIVKFRISNKSEEPIRITLQGPKTYYF